MDKYYTYAYLREDGTPYYIGKGNGGRGFRKRTNGVQPPKNKNKIIILKKDLTEEESFNHEKYMIAIFGRKDLGTGILRNKTNGGEGISGYRHTEKTKTKLSKISLGRKLTKKHKENVSASMKGKKKTPEHSKNISKGKLGEKNPNYGKKTPEKTKDKMRQSMSKKRWWNNGKKRAFVEECPGEGWVSGMKLESKKL
jgi:hypothetical protein